MGYVQPTEGYINFRWLRLVAGAKVKGAWLAGAEELTLFHLGDLMEGHPGHAPFLKAWPEMENLAASVQGREPRGVAYKPVGSDGDGDLYLPDYLAMAGLPVVVLGAHAADDPHLRDHLKGTVVVTPALVKRLGKQPAGTILWNISTFTEDDYRATGEWLLAPKPLRLELPQRYTETPGTELPHFLAVVRRSVDSYGRAVAEGLVRADLPTRPYYEAHVWREAAPLASLLATTDLVALWPPQTPVS